MTILEYHQRSSEQESGTVHHLALQCHILCHALSASLVVNAIVVNKR